MQVSIQCCLKHLIQAVNHRGQWNEEYQQQKDTSMHQTGVSFFGDKREHILPKELEHAHTTAAQLPKLPLHKLRQRNVWENELASSSQHFVRLPGFRFNTIVAPHLLPQPAACDRLSSTRAPKWLGSGVLSAQTIPNKFRHWGSMTERDRSGGAFISL